MAKFPTIEEMAQNVAEKALDEYEYKGKTLRQWIEIISASELGTNLASLGTDCISRQQAIDAFNTNIDELVVSGKENADAVERYLNRVIDEIKQLPPIQTEIIRCKDCKHWIPYDWMFSEVWRSKNMADYSEDEIGCNWCDMAMKANDFCSRGEKREVTT